MRRMHSRLPVAFLAAIAICVYAAPMAASERSYNYITPEDLKGRIHSGAPMQVLDIQVEEEFSRHHIKGSLPTYAYPVKSDADRAKLDAVYDRLASTSDPVVIVCPRGGGGAKRTYDHLADRGIPEDRMLILEKGQGGWPYPELLQGRQVR